MQRNAKEKNVTRLDAPHLQAEGEIPASGEIAVAVMVFLRYAMGEKAKDVTLTTIGELFPIGEQQLRKVAMGKL